MQPTAQDAPDANLGSIAAVLVSVVILFFGVLVLLAFRSLGDSDDDYGFFAHRYLVVDPDGQFVDDASFVFTMNSDDFSVTWHQDDIDSEGRVLGAALPSLFTVEPGGDEEEICLTEPFVFMWADTFDVAAEISAGTCLQNGGETQIVLSWPSTA